MENLTNDGIISVTLILFMLSLITERVSNFIKISLPKFFKKLEGDSEDKIRERRIQMVTGGIGILVAIACRADFFELMKSKGTLKAWESDHSFSYSFMLGCVITGVFLSQGSRFFHDLLDTLLCFKRMKQSLMKSGEYLKTLNDSKPLNYEELSTLLKAEKTDVNSYQ